MKDTYTTADILTAANNLRTFTDFVNQSYAIEGHKLSYRKLNDEIDLHRKMFNKLDAIKSDDCSNQRKAEDALEVLCDFVKNMYGVERGGDLRREVGMDVIVGSHRPPRGGTFVENALIEMLAGYVVVSHLLTSDVAYKFHKEFEDLHPFMDGNGRSGRALYYYTLQDKSLMERPLSFLHQWYYTSLSYGRD